jgi:carboxyl-terminal processing protease
LPARLYPVGPPAIVASRHAEFHVSLEPPTQPESPVDPTVVPGVDAPAADPGEIAPPPGPAPSRRAHVRSSGVLVVAIAITAVLAGSALFLSGWTLGRHAALTPGTPASDAEAFQPFWDTYSAIIDRYAGGEVDRKTLVEGAIKGMISALGDPYSQYLTSEEFKASLQGIAGQFEGIGATIGTVDRSGATSTCTTLGADCRLAVVAPLAGSPAEKAGLRPGDVIERIDDAALDGLTVDEARKRVRGPKDTAVRLSIARAGAAPFDLEIVRAVIVQSAVEAKDLANGDVAYIRLSGFSDEAAKAFDAAVAGAVARGQKALVVDLRANPGGFVTAARDIASQFLDRGTIFWQEDADGNLTETVAEPGGAATDPSIRLAVLVDGGSASASEIVAGALHDRGRATLVGSKTFGKGTVQQWTQLEDDSGGFRLTVAKWLTPDKTWIHGTGIVPDVVVTEAPAKPGDDPVIDAALKALDESATPVPSSSGAPTGARLRPAA